MDDAALVQRSAAGDKDAFAALYARYAARLYDFLWWVSQDREEASQALYDSFLDAGLRVAELRDPSKARAWLFAVASRRALRAAKASRRHGHEAGVDASPDDGATAWGELVEVVRATARELSPKERALLDLRFRQGLDGDELGDAIGARPDQLPALLDRLVERVEQTLAVTVVAYLGQRDCPELLVLLGDWDGAPLDARRRQIVERHAEGCPTCAPRRQRHIPASALLGVSPVLTVPAGLAEHVFEDVDLGGHRGPRWSARRDGFPPALIVDHERRRAIAAAAAAVVLLGAVAFLLTRGPHHAERVASVGSSVPQRAGTTTSVPVLTTLAPTSTTTALPGSDNGSLAGGGAGPAGGAGTGTGSGSGGSRSSGAGSSGTGGSGSPSDTEHPAEPATTSPPPTEPPTTATPDTQGPTLSGLTVSPSVVRAGNGCTNGDPATATVTVQASDPSGIASISVLVAGAQAPSVPMTASGNGTYSATVGPFTTSLPAGVDLPAQVVVQATDGANNPNATSGAALTLRCRA